MPNFSELKISPQYAETILSELYHINGTAIPLPGEIDFNFRIRTDNTIEYVLKISRPDVDKKYLDFQQHILEHLDSHPNNLIIPKVIKDINKKIISTIKDENGAVRYVRLLSWISGRLWNQVNPLLDDLRYSLGEKGGLLTKSLLNFEHPQAHRYLDWDIAKSIWTKQHNHLFESSEKDIITSFQNQFGTALDSYSILRKSVIHNDANDNNIIVTTDLIDPKVITTIDYGDAVYTQTINDLAVMCAYAIMHHNDSLQAALPIIKGYHASFPLQEDELEHLYVAIAMRLVISVTKSAINKIKEPQNSYLLISEKPAWELLKKWHAICPEFAHYSFRSACGFSVHPNESEFKKWASNSKFKLSNLFPSIEKSIAHHIDLSVSSAWIEHEQDFNNLDYFQYKINTLQGDHPNAIIAGGYLEPRPIYTSAAYDKIGNYGRESRTVHLGIDFWLPQQTPVHALFNGEVMIAVNDAGNKEYGGLVVLKHRVENFHFYTLYGHLSVESATRTRIGDLIKKGDCIAVLGNKNENGNWAPHLHFQVMLSILDYKVDFPGVTYNSQIDVWKGLCLDPNLLFKTEELNDKNTISNYDLITYRKQHIGKSLTLQYNVPLKIVRGSGQFLMDAFGRKYLDTVNNVAHVGHEQYQVVKAGQQQMALLNTNSRYLHENINILAQELIKTLPPELNVLHFVNSGSEANELAIRMAKIYTDEKDIIASEIGYHGNTSACIDISSYKFDGKGGKGEPEHTHIFPLPDAFRGKYKGKDAGNNYALEVQSQIEDVHKKGRGVAAFIIEPIISCGGQIELPKGFLKNAYAYTRKAKGLCISDEVQTGCGRMGKTFWGFQLHDVVPDIVTIGKPLGNGHPVAAVACTQEVATKFANGMEYFNTFGGNPVSCAIATAVLQTIKHEKLQKNALLVGDFLKSELKKLALTYPIIGDVRGQGLFLGVELIDRAMNPLPLQTDYVINRMKDYGILMSSDGPDHNVIKIKPPMVFNIENAKELILYLQKILSEDVMSNY